MKKTLLITSLMLAAGANAQVVESGFEAWTGNTPDGWAGSKSHTVNLAYSQVTESVHGGSSALGLATTGTDHRRFSTQPVTVENGVEYTVSLWVRGAGEVRVGLFDEREASSGFSPYSSWTAATSGWTQVTKTVTAIKNSSIAEFILSVRNATAPNILVVDDVTITSTGGLQTLSIRDIQFTGNPDGASPHSGEVVRTSGIVTGTYITYTNAEPPQPQYRYTYIQDASGAWNGIMLFDYVDNNNVANLGDAVTVVATVEEFNRLTQLSGIQSFEVTATGQAGPEPVVVETGDVAAEAFESVLVRVENATCTLVPSGASFGKWNVDDGSGDAVVGKLIHTVAPTPQLGQVFNVTGVVSFTNFNNTPEYNIQPRVAADVDLATSLADLNGADITIFPNPATNAVTLDLGTLNGRTEYSVIDATGRIVLTNVSTSVRNTIDVSTLTTGMYVMSLRNNGSTWSTRIAVQR